MKKVLYVVLSVCLCHLSKAQQKPLDLRILKALNQHDRPVWDNIMWGTSITIWPAMPVTVLSIAADGYIHNDKVMIRNAYKSALTIGFAALTSTALKYSVHRTRPKRKYPDDIIERDRAGEYSFPSGHTTSAFALATALSLSYNKWYVTVPAYLYAGLMGYSRMRLGMHFPTDVLGGMVIGIGTGFLVWELDKLVNR
jgi:membrane-associated phospholipid phosphatase